MPMLVVGEAAGRIDPATAQVEAAAAAAAWLDGADAESPQPSEARSLRGSGASEALVCACEDVRVQDLDRAIAEGFGHVELIKRRSGAGTGACQGKLCFGLIGEVLASRGVAAAFPTVRPPIRPVAVAALGGGP
jgi:NAD(P)H-nitrite reductase large subunit